MYMLQTKVKNFFYVYRHIIDKYKLNTLDLF